MRSMPKTAERMSVMPKTMATKLDPWLIRLVMSGLFCASALLPTPMKAVYLKRKKQMTIAIRVRCWPFLHSISLIFGVFEGCDRN